MKKTTKKKANKRTNQLIIIRRDDKIRHMLRVLVVRRMGELGWTTYRLAKELRGKVSGPPVYSFVSGRRDLRGESLVHVLKALGLEVRAKE